MVKIDWWMGDWGTYGPGWLCLPTKLQFPQSTVRHWSPIHQSIFILSSLSHPLASDVRGHAWGQMLGRVSVQVSGQSDAVVWGYSDLWQYRSLRAFSSSIRVLFWFSSTATRFSRHLTYSFFFLRHSRAASLWHNKDQDTVRETSGYWLSCMGWYTSSSLEQLLVEVLKFFFICKYVYTVGQKSI